MSRTFDSRGLIRFDRVDRAVMNFLSDHDDDINESVKFDVVCQLKAGLRKWRLVRLIREAIDFLTALSIVLSISWAASLVFLDIQGVVFNLGGIFAGLIIEGFLRFAMSNFMMEANAIALHVLEDTGRELERLILATRRGLPSAERDITSD